VGAVIEVADELPVNVVVLPGLDYLMLGSLRLVTIGNEPGLALDAPSLHAYQARLKRTVDVVVGGVLAVLTFPLLALCAIAIRLESHGPVLFRQSREGLNGKIFAVMKLRTMRNGAHEEDLPEDLNCFTKPGEDPRTTRVGRFLRKTSLDEVPQLWNVIRGDMSLVGPRPLALWEAELLGLRRRIVVRPGITGLWQVSGRSTLSPEERIRLDLVYIQNWSLLLDLSILLRTVPAVVARRGAY
jgi:lipopolysaccharide/colanic/teichoic acid biosynthesis glycosyltransferase